MTPRRHKLSLREENIILLRQAVCFCGCGEMIAGRPVQREHLVQLAMGGSDTVDNIAIWIEEHSKRKSFGSKATSAGSDAHARAKSRRLTKKQEEFRARLLAKQEGPPKPAPARRKKPWPKARPIPSRPMRRHA